MEQKLSKIRKAMLDTTFKDMGFSPEKKREVMQSISRVSKKNYRSYFFLKPVLSVVAGIIFFLGAGFFILEELNNQPNNSSIIKSGEQINDSLLELETMVGNERRIYKSISIDKADEAVLFNYKLPSYLPFSEKEPVVTITEWFGNKNNISLDIKYTPDSPTNGNRYIDLNVSNFPNIVSSIVKNNEYHKKITLGDNKGFLTKNKNVVIVSWIDNGLEYHLSYYSFNDADVSAELIKIAETMK